MEAEAIRFPYTQAYRLAHSTVKILSNKPVEYISRYFSKKILIHDTDENCTFRIFCIHCHDQMEAFKLAQCKINHSVRSKQFAKGYYVTDHFGEPIYQKVDNNNSIYLYGKSFDRIIWSYFVKYILLIESVKMNSVFIKAAAFRLNNKTSLIVGPGGSGKTVFLNYFCNKKNAEYITNSNGIIKDGILTGVGSTMRVRMDEDEILVDPADKFNLDFTKEYKIENIIFMKYGNQNKIIQIKDNDIIRNFLELFLMGINVYSLEEDLLHYLDFDYVNFSQRYQQMKNQIDNLISYCKVYYIDANIYNNESQIRIYNLIG